MSDFTKDELEKIFYNTMPGYEEKDEYGYGANNPWLKKLWNNTINEYLENFDIDKEDRTIGEEISNKFQNKIVATLDEVTKNAEAKIADTPEQIKYGEQKAFEEMVNYIEANTDKKSEVRSAMRNVSEKRKDEIGYIFPPDKVPHVYEEEIEAIIIDYADNYLYENYEDAIEYGIDSMHSEKLIEEKGLKQVEKYTKLNNALNRGGFGYSSENYNPEFGSDIELVPTKEVTDRIVNKNIERFIKENNIKSPEEYFIKENNKLLKKLDDSIASNDSDEYNIENLFESEEEKSKDVISGRKL